MTLKEWNEQPGMLTFEEWCKLNGVTTEEMAIEQEAQEDYALRFLVEEQRLAKEEGIHDAGN